MKIKLTIEFECFDHKLLQRIADVVNKSFDDNKTQNIIHGGTYKTTPLMHFLPKELRNSDAIVVNVQSTNGLTSPVNRQDYTETEVNVVVSRPIEYSDDVIKANIHDEIMKNISSAPKPTIVNVGTNTKPKSPTIQDFQEMAKIFNTTGLGGFDMGTNSLKLTAEDLKTFYDTTTGDVQTIGGAIDNYENKIGNFSGLKVNKDMFDEFEKTPTNVTDEQLRRIIEKHNPRMGYIEVIIETDRVRKIIDGYANKS